jgi:hypothetical protein
MMLAAIASVLLGGCDEAPGGRGLAGNDQSIGKGDDAEGEGEEGDDASLVAFIDAVDRCEALADRGRATISEARIEQRHAVETTRLECLTTANDDTLDVIEATLAGDTSELAGDGTETFAAWREANAEFCDLLVKASDVAVEKDADVHEVRCAAQAEFQLAQAIVAYADLGGAPADAPEAREAYATCYEAFDTALEVEPVEGDGPEGEVPVEGDEAAELETVVAAHQTLADCIETATTDLDDELAARINASFPGRGIDNLQETINGDFASTEEAATSLCNVLGAASIAAGEPEAELFTTRCLVSTSIWRARLLGDVVPELAPTAPEDDEAPTEGENDQDP